MKLDDASRDRNFDDIADHFAKKIYTGLKGELRKQVIWRDLELSDISSKINQNTKLRILDLGAGIGHFSSKFAQLGCHVCYNDISQNMANLAMEHAIKLGVRDAIQWHVKPWQKMLANSEDKYDCVLCHALLEWVAYPELLVQRLKTTLNPGALISLCFYNPQGLIYHNLIRGNFDWVNKTKQENGFEFATDKGGLTPSNPCSYNQVSEWLRAINCAEVSLSGIRVFSDYVSRKSGGNLVEGEILKQELKYSLLEPYKRLGRYLHVVARYDPVQKV